MTFPNELGQYRDGLYRRRVVNVVSTVNRIAAAGTSKGIGPLTAEESGTYFYVPTLTAAVHTLPRISSKWLGLEYTYYVADQASSGAFKINCVLDSSAKIKMNFSSEVDEHTSISPGSKLKTAITLTAVSSVVWMGQPLSHNGYSHTSDATSNLCGWTTA